ncbi:RNA-binding domain-containing protein [Rhodococcus sp. NPDC055112]
MTPLTAFLDRINSGTSADKCESSTLDFKTEKGSLKETAVDIAEAAVCFANAGGGTVVLGVRDTPGGPDALIGTSIDADLLRTRLYDLTTPHLLVSVEAVDYNGARLLAITVPEGVEVYATSKGAYTQRQGDKCRPMNPSEVSRLADERRGRDWSSGPSDSRIDDIDPGALDRARELLRESGDEAKQRLAVAPPAELLNRLGLVCDDQRLTRAGELLFVSRAPSGPQEVLVYQHRKTKSGEADYSRRWTTPLITCFAEAYDVITARLTITPVNLASGHQLRIEDYPSVALREALTNALTHRDYRENRPVLIRHSPFILEIDSPGPLVAGVTPENILTRGTKPRYPLLATAFNTFGWGEYLGQGVNRMFREMARSGRPLPAISSDSEQVEVVFRGDPPNANIARLVAELPIGLKDDTDTLIILLTLCTKRSVTASQIAPLIQRDTADAEESLRHLSNSDIELIEPTSGTRNRRNPNYRFRGEVLARLGPAVTYHTRSSGEVEKKVIDHVREYESVNNATIQRLFDLDVYAARDILRELVGREIITRTSTQKRGSAVRYGKGPRFPENSPRRKRSEVVVEHPETLF